MDLDDRRTAAWDFLDWLGSDTSTCIFRLLDDPADLARAAAVSRSWRRFVADSEFCKALCLRICPEAATFTAVVDVARSPPPAHESSTDADLRARDSRHRIYSRLAGAIASADPSDDCIAHCLAASTTDNFPAESIDNTLVPLERVNNDHSYWSSAGHDDPDVPETLTYRLNSQICLVNEIRIRPYQAVFQDDHPIYSSKLVRIHMGHSKLPPKSESFVTHENENLGANDDGNYVWTYTSPEFPMLQKNELQSFKLPRPVLCIGGVVKIELLGRIQKQATDDRYYICVCHAQVIGRLLSPVFTVDISDSAGYSTLKYQQGGSDSRADDTSPADAQDKSGWHSIVTRYRQMTRMVIMNVLLGPVPFMDEDDAEAVTDDDLYM